MTLHSYLKNVVDRYIYEFSEESETQSKVERRGLVSNTGRNLGGLTQKLDMKMLRKIVTHEPLLKKAIFKKNRDTFKNWFLVKDDNNDIVPEKVLKIIKNFDKKSNFPNVLWGAGTSSNIYGTGFIEKIYNEHGNTKASSDVYNPDGSLRNPLVNLNLLDSERITERKHRNDTDVTLYPVYKPKNGTEEVFINPSRLSVVRIDKLPYSYFGISTVTILHNILKSKMNADVSSGEILNRFGHGLIDITITDMDGNQEKNAEKKVKEQPDYLIHDQEHEITVVNPTSIDPEPFYDYFYTNIASALDMPKHMLTGSELGNVTGTEVGVSAYYSDIQNLQRLVFTPIIEEIYSELLESHGMEWKYHIDWNPIYVDELSEAKILQTRVYAAVQSVNSVQPIISVEEARKMLNEGEVELDTSKIPDMPKNDDAPGTSDPNVEPQPVKKPEKNIDDEYVVPLTQAQQDMITKFKLKGKLEEVEQEKRLKEAGVI